jgi:hypothetical protein
MTAFGLKYTKKPASEIIIKFRRKLSTKLDRGPAGYVVDRQSTLVFTMAPHAGFSADMELNR